ncbi:GIY-YIG nuclease family protein [Actinokineospora sp. G85]|uniref:GIY-YIG nuclease family protein n=1 Tax=Actinokineospora sp. G85 TaxID=3406626 RepID=UPI003C706BD2
MADQQPESVSPSPAVRAELERYLHADLTRLGDVYRGLQEALSAEEIAAKHSVSSYSFVWNYSQIIKALLEETLPDKPTMAMTVLRRIRKMLRKPQNWSPETLQFLVNQKERLEQRSEDTTAREAEDEEARERTSQAEASNVVGIYVYALPHYLRHPFDPDTGRTLMKVGHSGRDVISRFREQTRTTALPEEPVLLRIYNEAAKPSAEVESTFHRLLEAAGHSRSVARSAGREWFLTSIKFLDEIARALDMPVQVITSADPDDD